MESKLAVSPCVEPTADAKSEVAVTDPPPIEEEVLYDDFVHYRVAALSPGCFSGKRGKPIEGKKDHGGSVEEKRVQEDGGKEEEDDGEKQADADADADESSSSSSSSRTVQASEITTGERGLCCVKGRRLTKFEREHLASTRGLHPNVKFLTSTYLGEMPLQSSAWDHSRDHANFNDDDRGRYVTVQSAPIPISDKKDDESSSKGDHKSSEGKNCDDKYSGGGESKGHEADSNHQSEGKYGGGEYSTSRSQDYK
jgi:hypothetical protein